MSKNKKNKDPNKIGTGTLLLWSGSGASCAVQTILLSFLILYCTNALGLSAAVLGTILMLSKILDAITDLLAGYVVDRTNTKLGRGRPYMLCVIGLWFTTWMCFAVPAQLSDTGKYVWIFVSYSLCQAVFRTLLNAANTPYMVRAFNNDQKYVTISSMGGLITTVVVIVFNVLFPSFYAGIISDAAGWSKLVMCLAIPMTIVGLLAFFFIPEKYTVEDTSQHITLKDIVSLLKSNKYIYPLIMLNLIINIAGNMGVSSYYFLYIVKNVEISGVMSLLSIISMLTLLVYPALLKRISARKLMQYSLIASISSGLILFLAKDNLILLGIGCVISGAVTLPCSYLLNLVIIECADFNEWQNRPRMEGTINSTVGFGNQIGAALGTFLIGLLLTAANFDGTLDVQPDSATMMIRCCYSLVPMAFELLGAFALHFYDLDKMKPQISADLAKRRKNLPGQEQQA